MEFDKQFMLLDIQIHSGCSGYVNSPSNVQDKYGPRLRPGVGPFRLSVTVSKFVNF
jgi:hypothetical protein